MTRGGGTSPIRTVLDALEAHGCHPQATGSQWKACCPAHEDGNPSLSVREGDDGRALLKCFAGCDAEQVVIALGLELADLFTDRGVIEGGGGQVDLIAYTYQDLDGSSYLQVRRYPNKQFRQFRWEDGEWRPGLKGCQSNLYRLPELVAAGPEEFVFVVEGEKDVERLREHGLVATTNPGGAGKWRPEYGQHLRDRVVVVVPDNDDVGRNHARKVAASLAGVARAVALVELQSLPEKGDISDWLDAGHSADQLLELATAELAKGGPRRADVIRLVDVHKSDVDWLWVGHLARGAITVLDGDPGVGKSLLVAAVAARISTGRALPGGEAHAPATVLLLDAENDHESALKPRVMAAGGDANKVLLYSPPEPDSHVDLDRQEHVDRLEAAVREYGAALLVIDPFVALLGRSVDTFRDQDVRRVLLRLARLAKRCRCAVLLVRHLNKGAGSKAIYRGGGSIGVSAAARVGLLMARDDGDPAVRLLATTKNNLGPEAPTRQVVICSTDGQVPVIEFGKEVSRSADDIVGDEVPEARSARREAMEFLRETLREGARPSKDVVYEARQVGISKGTLLRAAKALGVLHRARAKSGERGMQGWDWELPGDQGDQLPQPSKVSRLITLIPEWEVQAEADEAAPTGSMVADAPPEGLSPAVESEEPAADPSGGSESALCPSCGGDMLYWRDLGYVCRGCKRRLPEPAEEALA